MTNQITDAEITEIEEDGDPLAGWDTPDIYSPNFAGRAAAVEDVEDDEDERTADAAEEAEPIPDFDASVVHAAFRDFEAMERLQRDDRYAFADRIATDPAFANTVVEWRAYLKQLNDEYGTDLPTDASVREVKLAVVSHNRAMTAAAKQTAKTTRPAAAKRAAPRTPAQQAPPADAPLDYRTEQRTFLQKMAADTLTPQDYERYARAERERFGD
ncbi:MAG: hypothetical protein AB7R89_11615 [Dehalococcoidia bacterium]